jgi:hypothetical protein
MQPTPTPQPQPPTLKNSGLELRSGWMGVILMNGHLLPETANTAENETDYPN